MRRWLGRYGLPTLLGVLAVLKAVEGDWLGAALPAAVAFYVLTSDSLVRALRDKAVAEYRLGYARGVYTALRVELHQRTTGERRPIPGPDRVHPDDELSEWFDEAVPR